MCYPNIYFISRAANGANYESEKCECCIAVVPYFLASLRLSSPLATSPAYLRHVVLHRLDHDAVLRLRDSHLHTTLQDAIRPHDIAQCTNDTLAALARVSCVSSWVCNRSQPPSCLAVTHTPRHTPAKLFPIPLAALRLPLQNILAPHPSTHSFLPNPQSHVQPSRTRASTKT